MSNAPRRLQSLGLLLSVGLFAACGFEVYDDVDLTLNFLPLVGPSEALHSPYVKGARFGVYVRDQGDQSRVEAGWRLESAQPGVLSISDVTVVEYERDGKKRRYLVGRATAVDEGQATLIVRRSDGDEVYRREIEVLRPDRVDLLAHGLLLIDRPDSEALTPDLQVFRGGTATFLARYFRGGRALLGNGTLSAQAQGAVDVLVRKTFLFEDRDWLSISARSEGTSQVDLLVAGEVVSRVSVTAVNDSAIQQVRLRQSDRASLALDVQDGDWLVVLAEALDRQGRPVYGVEYKWNFGGVEEAGLGDLYRYEFKRGMRRMLLAQHGAQSAALMIEAKKGFVDSTNRLGCALVGHGRPAAAALPLLWIGIGLVVARRRRRKG